MKQEMTGWQWHQLDHMQIDCPSLQTDNHTSTSSLKFYRPDALHDAQPTVSNHWKTMIRTEVDITCVPGLSYIRPWCIYHQQIEVTAYLKKKVRKRKNFDKRPVKCICNVSKFTSFHSVLHNVTFLLWFDRHITRTEAAELPKSFTECVVFFQLISKLLILFKECFHWLCIAATSHRLLCCGHGSTR